MPPNSYTTAHSQDSNLPTLPKDSAIIQPYLRGLRIYVHVYKNSYTLSCLKNFVS